MGTLANSEVLDEMSHNDVKFHQCLECLLRVKETKSATMNIFRIFLFSF